MLKKKCGNILRYRFSVIILLLSIIGAEINHFFMIWINCGDWWIED